MSAGDSFLNVSSNPSRSRIAIAMAGAVGIFAGGLLVGEHLRFSTKPTAADLQLAARVSKLDAELHQRPIEGRLPPDIIANSRDSICLIISSYRFTDAAGREAPGGAHHLLASGFLIEKQLLASNRHVLEPWFGDPQSERLMRMGLVPHRESITAYFPGLAHGIVLDHFFSSKTTDVAVARLSLPGGTNIRPLSLANQPSSPGDPVIVMGYPLGVTTMLAKSTAIPYQLSGLRQNQRDVERLAQFKLIRPSATQGHLVDTTDMTLMYDASTAHGSSGGPVFNMRGEVIGVNAALIDGFQGTSLGVSISALQELLKETGKQK